MCSKNEISILDISIAFPQKVKSLLVLHILGIVDLLESS